MEKSRNERRNRRDTQKRRVKIIIQQGRKKERHGTRENRREDKKGKRSIGKERTEAAESTPENGQKWKDNNPDWLAVMKLSNYLSH